MACLKLPFPNGKGSIIPTTALSIAGIITVMALQAGGGGQLRGVAITTGGSLMVDAGHFATAVGMRQVESSRAPGAGVMALVAGYASEKTNMEGGVRMAGGTGCIEAGKDLIGMALGAG
jgi:hypothetical protein